jgi:tetratricopeptide (TPR) repeat protein
MFSAAIERDPNFAAAYGMSARCYSMRKASGWMADPRSEIAETKRLARRAAELGKDNAIALCTAGIGLAFVVGDLDDGASLIGRSLELDPNLAWAWLFSGWTKVWLGEPKAALEHFDRAMRLSPQDPHIFNMQAAVAAANFFAGHFAEALSWAEMSMRVHAHLLLAACVAAASAALLGQKAEAEKAMQRVHQCDPSLRQSNLHELLPIRNHDDFVIWADGLRQAGLPS